MMPPKLHHSVFLPQTEAARHLFDNQKQPPQMQTKVDAITQSVLDDLLYEAHQYDATQIASLGIPTSETVHASSDRMSGN
jgi:hypothetical protein